MTKKLALIFAILVLSQTLFSCSDTSEDTTLSETASSMAETGGTAGEESAETIAEEETRQMHAVPSDLDYGGETFTIVYPNWQGYNYYFFANEYTGDVMNDAIFSRKSKVEDTIKITMTETCPGYRANIPDSFSLGKSKRRRVPACSSALYRRRGFNGARRSSLQLR